MILSCPSAGEVQADPREDPDYFHIVNQAQARQHVARAARGRGRGRGRKRKAAEPMAVADVEVISSDGGEERQVEVAAGNQAPPPPPPPIVVPEQGRDVAVPPEPLAAAQPALGDLPPVNIEPKVRNENHREIVATVLPYLRHVMLDSNFATQTQRDQVKRALSLVDAAGRRFWGADLMYSRRRTVEDAVLSFGYADEVRMTL